MYNDDLIKKLHVQGSWSLFGLFFITFGIYIAYYIKKQTLTINSFLTDKDKLSYSFINIIIVLSYLSAILALIPENTNNSILNDFSFYTGNLLFILITIWGFKVKNRLNNYYDFNKSSIDWFHGLWTFLFTTLYFNYHINCINERIIKKELDENFVYDTLIEEKEKSYKISFQSKDDAIWENLKEELKIFYTKYQFFNIVVDNKNSWMIKSDVHDKSYISLSIKNHLNSSVLTLEVYNFLKPNLNTINEIIQIKENTLINPSL